MLSRLELEDLTVTENLPTTRFFDWDDEERDIVLIRWIGNMRDKDIKSLYHDADVWFFDDPAPYAKLLSVDKNKIYAELEEQIIYLVDQINGEDEPQPQWGTA